MTAELTGRARTIYQDALVWDTHSGFMPDPAADLSNLGIWRDAGVDYLSIDVGFDYMPWEKTVSTLANFRHWLLARPDEYVLARNLADVQRAKGEGKLAVTFDLEGLNALDGRLEMVQFYYDLGVRQMLFAYNRNNLLGGGCHDQDVGLSDFGRSVIDEMNRLGVFVDVSHCSHRTTLEAIEHSADPVIFSHSNPRAIRDHERNIRDDQIKACAAKGGVVGIVGVSFFLGEDDDVSASRFADHIDYVIQLVGPEHVGLGLDYSFPVDCEWIEQLLQDNPHLWPKGQGYERPVKYFAPAQLLELTEVLLTRGHSEATVRGVLGANFMRVAEHVWK